MNINDVKLEMVDINMAVICWPPFYRNFHTVKNTSCLPELSVTAGYGQLTGHFVLCCHSFPHSLTDTHVKASKTVATTAPMLT